MINRYNKLVWDYINGEEIDNIDELENDYKFMMEVINVSKDKNIYNLCSDEVKKNYEFVRFVIETFKSDKDFVDKVATEYFDKVGSSDMTARELYFIMREIFSNSKDDRSLFYNVTCFDMYLADRSLISNLIISERESFGNDNLGLGFAYVISYHASKSDVITRYYAKKFLHDIFYNNEKMSLEELVHSRAKDVESIKANGVKQFILDYVRSCDVYLSDYLFAHIDLVKDIEKDINYVIRNWDKFNSDTLDRKNIIFEQEVNNLISKYNLNFDYCEVCYYLDHNLNLPVKFGMDGCGKSYGIDINKISLIEYQSLRLIIKLAQDLYNSPVIDIDYELEPLNNNSKTNKGRVLEFKSNKNKTI